MGRAPIILAVETSCDETAVAVLRGPGTILASEISSQIALHRPYGGVVPEVASRNHLTHLRPVFECALEKAGVALTDVDAFAATSGPGLASSLLIGHTTAKALALGCGKPFYAVNHLEGHLLSPFQPQAATGAEMIPEVAPGVALVVSGGHTLLVDIAGFDRYRILGRTRDDAAGEAFDKGAKLLGLPYPGGPEIERTAQAGSARAFAFPRGLMERGNLEFSFSGLKTSLLYLWQDLTPDQRRDRLPDLCASFQEAIVEVLVAKTMEAVRQTGRSKVAVSGGVSCNQALRARLEVAARERGVDLLLAPRALCTDNAAMIAFVALLKLAHGAVPTSLQNDVDPNLALLDYSS